MRLLRLVCIVLSIIWVRSAFAQTVAFEVQDPELIPEGIAFDSATGKFYLSSIAKNKIIETTHGKTNDFIQPGQFGFVGGLGIHVDAIHHVLWACSGDFDGHSYSTGIFAFDLATRKLRSKFYLPTDTSRNFFNDLTIADNGDVFITNSDNNSIWHWKFKAPRPEKMILPKIAEPNGIVWDKERNLLFIATRKGLMALSLKSNTLHTLVMTGDENSSGLDGLVLYKNSVIAVRNGFRDKSRHGIVQFYLSTDGLTVVKTRSIDLNNPLFDIPTTLTIHGDQLFVIGNSQMDKLDAQKNISDHFALKKPVILRYTMTR